MQRRVLIPMDGTEAAERALAFVEQLQDKQGLEVLLVSVWEADERFLGGDAVARARVPRVLSCIAHNLETYLLEAEQRLRRQGIQARCEAFPGNPSLDLQAIAGQEQVEVIITGPKGLDGPRCQQSPLRWCRGPCPIVA